MEGVKVCRICLIMDKKMYYIQYYPLCVYFEVITGVNPLNSDLPPYTCYECTEMMKKYYFFREKCLRGQSTLYDVIHENKKISEEEVRKIDRGNLNLLSNISIFTSTEENIITYEYTEPVAPLEVKEELENHFPCNQSFEIDNVKEEDDSLPFPSSIFTDSDDNEPLSIHKSEKKKAAKKRGKKSKVIEKMIETIQVNGIEELEVPEDILAESLVSDRKRDNHKRKLRETKETKRKKRYNPNEGDVDLEECVTIIKLTLEEQKEEIEKRKESTNYLNAQFQCNQCYKGFIDTNAWKNHIRKHDPSAGEAVCEVCKVRFKNKRALTKHATNHETKYKCKSCSFVSKTTTQAKQHQRWHKGVLYKCQYCDEVSTKWTSHLSHVRMKHPSEFICGICGYSFVSKLGLNMHKTMMHKDVADKSEDETESSEGHYCKECDVKFVSQEAWKRHMVTSVKHSLNTDFKNGCRVCGETFGSAEEVRLHHRRAHAKQRPKNYGKKASILTWPTSCEHCSKMIGNARELWAHFRRAHPDKNYPTERNYICDICGKGFRGNAFLEYHKRTHGAERPFACGQCPKAFYTRTNLHMHLRSHSDHRPFPCDLCCKAFKCRGALNRHIRCHTGDKPYVCEVCGKAFNQSNSHKVHVRTVHLKQPAPYISRARLERRRNKDLPPQTYAFQQ